MSKPKALGELNKVKKPIPKVEATEVESEEKTNVATQLAVAIQESYEFIENVNQLGTFYAVKKGTFDRPFEVGESGRGLRDVALLAGVEKLGRHPGKNAVADGCDLVAAQLRGGVIPAIKRVIGLRSYVFRREAGAIREIVIDCAEPGSHRVIVVDRAGWRYQNGHPDVAFILTQQTRPLPNLDGVTASYDALWEMLSFDKGRQRDLIRGWLANVYVSDEERPMPFFAGVPGAGKTTRAAAVLLPVSPPKVDGGSPIIGGRLSRNIDAEQTKAVAQFVVGYDNLPDKVSDEASDHISRLVTGDSMQKRKLYSDSDLYEVAYKRTGVMTGVSIPNFKDDAIMRIIPIHLEVINDGQRVDRSELWGAYEARAGEVLAAVLDDLVLIIKGQGSGPTKKPRMAGYYSNLWRLDQALGEQMGESFLAAIEESEEEQVENDLLIQTILKAIEDRDGVVTASTMDELREVVEGYCPLDKRQYLPQKGKSFSAALNIKAHLLASVGVRYSMAKSNGQRTHSLRRDERDDS